MQDQQMQSFVKQKLFVGWSVIEKSFTLKVKLSTTQQIKSASPRLLQDILTDLLTQVNPMDKANAATVLIQVLQDCLSAAIYLVANKEQGDMLELVAQAEALDINLSYIFYFQKSSRESIIYLYQQLKLLVSYDPFQSLMNKKSTSACLKAWNTIFLSCGPQNQFFTLLWDCYALLNHWQAFVIDNYQDCRPFYLNLIVYILQANKIESKRLLDLCYTYVNQDNADNPMQQQKLIAEDHNKYKSQRNIEIDQTCANLIQDQMKIQEHFSALEGYASALFLQLDQSLKDMIGEPLPSAIESKQAVEEEDSFLTLKKVKKSPKSVQMERNLLSTDTYQDKDFIVDKYQLTSNEDRNFVNTLQVMQETQVLRSKLLESRFIVIDGELASGKTSLVRHLHHLHQQMKSRVHQEKQSALQTGALQVGALQVLFIDNQTDLKSLMGSYVCSEKIGLFEWKTGPLISAMETGAWLLLKNLQEANEEVYHGLLEVAAIGQAALPSQGRTVKAHYAFKIIGVGNFKAREYESKRLLLQNRADFYYKKQPLNKNSLEKILQKNFSKFASSLSLLQEPLDNITTLLLGVGAGMGQERGAGVETVTKAVQGVRINAGKVLKLFTRLQYHLGRIYGDQGIQNGLLTEEFRKLMYAEVVDCFLGGSKEALVNENVNFQILKILKLQPIEHCLLVLEEYPKIEVTQKHVLAGRLGAIARNSFFVANQDENQENKKQPSEEEKQPLQDSTSFGVSGGFNTVSAESAASMIVYNAYSSRLMVRILACIVFDEPCLLVGDTGCGKTTLVQHCAQLFGKKLHVYNMNQGSDAIDLIGGFKPIDVRLLLKRLLIKYVKLFEHVAKLSANRKFLDTLRQLFAQGQYTPLMQCMLESIGPMKEKLSKRIASSSLINQKSESNVSGSTQDTKSITVSTTIALKKLIRLQKQLESIYGNRDKMESNLAFHFVEGNLVRALKRGDWILIDEVNLAGNDVLQRLLPIVEQQASLTLFERGDVESIPRHPHFRLFACMNPGQEVGKKELPENVRAKFTELFIHDISKRDDLLLFVSQKLPQQLQIQGNSCLNEKIVDLFMAIRRASDASQLEDGYNRRQHVSLRNLSRALAYIRGAAAMYGLDRALLDGLHLGFGTALSAASQSFFEKQLESIIGPSMASASQNLLSYKMRIPEDSVSVLGFLIKKGPQPLKKAGELDFLVTETFQRHLIELLRAAQTELPVLLEGPTSSGKTSLVKYLAALTGHKCVRVNNHQHTDVEEYVGKYLPDATGRLVFHPGVLVEALEQGHWLVLDELNLARSEILESLNRLLDDNRELFIAETQQTVKPHPHFRVFATQNPTSYGGRKELSKAFKNRFVPVFFGEISDFDLEQILLKRCPGIAPSYCRRLMTVVQELRVFRQRNNFFTGKEGVITMRDLLKWGTRSVSSLDELAMEGYCLLAERLRIEEERLFIKTILQKQCRLSNTSSFAVISEESFYNTYCQQHLRPFLQQWQGSMYIQMNKSFQRMAALALKALQQNEPVLLIGETGCGKTTLSQIIAGLRNCRLFSINCHQYTESADFLGSLRPVRNKESLSQRVGELLHRLSLTDGASTSTIYEGETLVKYLQNPTIAVERRMEVLRSFIKKQKIDNQAIINEEHFSMEDAGELEQALISVETLFEWQDGPLVEAMKEGGLLLIDEIALAEDSVLERLNSVLESERTLLLPEKGGGEQAEEIVAHARFAIIATMNPSGDFGKRELSPALRNRFTEIWVEPITSKKFLMVPDTIKEEPQISQTQLLHSESQNSAPPDIYLMIQEYLQLRLFTPQFTQMNVQPMGDASPQEIQSISAWLCQALYSFLAFYNTEFCERYSMERKNLTMRDILAIMDFIQKCCQKSAEKGKVHNLFNQLMCLYRNGLEMVVVEPINLMSIAIQEKINMVAELNGFIEQQLKGLNQGLSLVQNSILLINDQNYNHNQGFGFYPFFIQSKANLDLNQANLDYCTTSSLVQQNVRKLARALQLDKAVLLEGMPGVGKSSLVEYAALATGNKLVKISLSEQTDIVDLLGSDLPAPNKDLGNDNHSMKFQWYDGALLDALKRGHWILLEELNLASQSVLEGLNAILDHRGTVFIPEMNQSFTKHPDFRMFATQNPMSLGGSRKGLPNSFLNRFTKVYLPQLKSSDITEILTYIYSSSHCKKVAEKGKTNDKGKYLQEEHKSGLQSQQNIPLKQFISEDFIKKVIEYGQELERQLNGNCNISVNDSSNNSGNNSGNSNSQLFQLGSQFNLRDYLRFCKIYLAFERNIHSALHAAFGGSCERRFPTLFNQATKIDYLKNIDNPIASAAIKVFGEEYSKSKSLWEQKGPTSLPRHFGLVSACGSKTVLLNNHAEKIAWLHKIMASPLFGESYFKNYSKSEIGSFIVSGGNGSGKREFIRLLAELHGKELIEQTLTPSTDSSDLIGSYDQVDLQRELSRFQQSAAVLIEDLVAHAEKELQLFMKEINSSQVGKRQLQQHIGSVLQKVFSLLQIKTKILDIYINPTEAKTQLNLEINYNQQQTLLQQQLNRIRQALDQLEQQVGRGNIRLNTLKEKFEQLCMAFGANVNNKDINKSQQVTTGSFEWFFAKLINAAQNGQWLALSNVAQANQAILARIIPLLETSITGHRQIIVTECHDNFSKSSGPMIINVHQDFRLFLLWNHEEGNSGNGGGEQSLSLSIQNKCLEICLDQHLAIDPLSIVQQQEYTPAINNNIKVRDIQRLLRYISDLKKICIANGLSIQPKKQIDRENTQKQASECPIINQIVAYETAFICKQLQIRGNAGPVRIELRSFCNFIRNIKNYAYSNQQPPNYLQMNQFFTESYSVRAERAGITLALSQNATNVANVANINNSTILRFMIRSQDIQSALKFLEKQSSSLEAFFEMNQVKKQQQIYQQLFFNYTGISRINQTNYIVPTILTCAQIANDAFIKYNQSSKQQLADMLCQQWAKSIMSLEIHPLLQSLLNNNQINNELQIIYCKIREIRTLLTRLQALLTQLPENITAGYFELLSIEPKLASGAVQIQTSETSTTGKGYKEQPPSFSNIQHKSNSDQKRNLQLLFQREDFQQARNLTLSLFTDICKQLEDLCNSQSSSKINANQLQPQLKVARKLGRLISSCLVLLLSLEQGKLENLPKLLDLVVEVLQERVQVICTQCFPNQDNNNKLLCLKSLKSYYNSTVWKTQGKTLNETVKRAAKYLSFWRAAGYYEGLSSSGTQLLVRHAIMFLTHEEPSVLQLQFEASGQFIQQLHTLRATFLNLYFLQRAYSGDGSNFRSIALSLLHILFTSNNTETVTMTSPNATVNTASSQTSRQLRSIHKAQIEDRAVNVLTAFFGQEIIRLAESNSILKLLGRQEVDEDTKKEELLQTSDLEQQKIINTDNSSYYSHELRVQDEFTDEVLKLIPIIVDQRALHVWTLKFAFSDVLQSQIVKQDDTSLTQMQDSGALGNMQFVNGLKSSAKLREFLAFSGMACLFCQLAIYQCDVDRIRKDYPSQAINNITQICQDIVNIVDEPSLPLMKCIGALARHGNASNKCNCQLIREQVEAVVLCSIKAKRVIQDVELEKGSSLTGLRSVTQLITSASIRNIPLIYFEVQRLQKAVRLYLQLSEPLELEQSGRNVDNDLKILEPCQIQSLLAYKWLATILTRCSFEEVTKSSNLKLNAHQQCSKIDEICTTFSTQSVKQLKEIVEINISGQKCSGPSSVEANLASTFDELQQIVGKVELLKSSQTNVSQNNVEIFSSAALGLEILKLFFLDTQEIEQSMLQFLRDDVQYSIERVEAAQQIADYCASNQVEQQETLFIDTEKPRHVQRAAQLQRVSLHLQEMKKRLVCRAWIDNYQLTISGNDSGDGEEQVLLYEEGVTSFNVSSTNNFSAFEQFINQTRPLLQKINLLTLDGLLSSLHTLLMLETNQIIENNREQLLQQALEQSRHIDNWINYVFDQFYVSFSDFLIPQMLGLHLVSGGLNQLIRILGQPSKDRECRSSNIFNGSLVENCQFYQKLQNRYFDHTQDALMDLKHCMRNLKGEISMNQSSGKSKSQSKTHKVNTKGGIDRHVELSNYFSVVLAQAKAALTWKEQTDKLIEDDAKKFIKIQRRIEGMVVDEYTQQAVDKQKDAEAQDIQASFNMFTQEYTSLLATTSSVREKIEQKQAEIAEEERAKQMRRILDATDQKEAELDQTSAWDGLTHFQREELQDRALNALLDILNLDYECAEQSAYTFDHVPSAKSFKKHSLFLSQMLLGVKFQSSQSQLVNLTASTFPSADKSLLSNFCLSAETLAELSQIKMIKLPAVYHSESAFNKKEEVTQEMINALANSYNVYNDQIHSETSKAYIPLMRLLSRIQFLLTQSEFLHNQVLYNLAILCNFVLELDFYHTPLSKLITGLQFVMEKCEEWDHSVPHIFALRGESQHIETLLLHWRKLERCGWRVMLEQKEREVQKLDVVMFLKLKTLLQEFFAQQLQRKQQQQLKENYTQQNQKSKSIQAISRAVKLYEEEEIFKILDEFICSATMGNFHLRLKMLRFLADYGVLPLSREGEGDKEDQRLFDQITRKIIRQVHAYYNQIFLQKYLESIDAERKGVEKDIDDYRKLAGWDSNNYLILKATVEKFHKKIFRICKKYKDFLGEPARIHVFDKRRTETLCSSFEHFQRHYFPLYTDEAQQICTANYTLFVDQLANSSKAQSSNNMGSEDPTKSIVQSASASVLKQGARLLTENQLELDDAKYFTSSQVRLQQISLANQLISSLSIAKGEVKSSVAKEDCVNHNLFPEESIHCFYQTIKKEEAVDQPFSELIQNEQTKVEQTNIDDKLFNSVQKSDKPTNQAEASQTNWVMYENIIQIIFERMGQLKDDKAVTKMMKTKALLDLFATLKGLGFTSYYKTTASLMKDNTIIYDFEILDVQQLSFSSELHVLGRSLQLKENIGKAEDYYFQMLDQICELKNNCASYAKDLSTENIRKSTGFTIEMFFFFRRFYKAFSEVLAATDQIVSYSDSLIMNQLEYIGETLPPNSSYQAQLGQNKLDQTITLNHKSCSLDYSIIKDIQFMLKENRRIISMKGDGLEVGKDNGTNLAKQFELPISTANGIIALLNTVPGFRELEQEQKSVFSINIVYLEKIMQSLILLSCQFENLLKSIRNNNRNTLDVYYCIKDKLQEATKSLQDIVQRYCTNIETQIQKKSAQINEERSSDQQQFQNDNILRLQLFAQNLIKTVKKYKSFLTDFQETNNLVDKSSKSGFEDSPLSKDNATTASALEEGSNQQLNKAVDTSNYSFVQNEEWFLKKLSFILRQFPYVTQQDASALGSEGLQLLQLISVYLHNLLFFCSKALRSLTKFCNLIGLIVTNLVFRGFCHPDKDQDQEGDGKNEEGGEVQEGTGIGQGQGVQNVSKEMEFEEQMLGQQNEEENSEQEDSNKPQQGEKEEDEFSMDQDFQGQTLEKENMEEKEKEEAEKEGDEEFSQVDDEVDFKMWQGDEAEEEQQEEDKENSNEDNEEDKKRRKKDDLEFKEKNDKQQKKKDQNWSAKEGDKPKEKQRNLEDFEEVDEQEQQEGDDDEINEQGEEEDIKNEKDFQDQKEGEKLDSDRLNQEEEEQLSLNQQGEEEEDEDVGDDDDDEKGDQEKFFDPLEKLPDDQSDDDNPNKEEEQEMKEAVENKEERQSENSQQQDDDKNSSASEKEDEQQQKDYPQERKKLKNQKQQKPQEQDKKYGQKNEQEDEIINKEKMEEEEDQQKGEKKEMQQEKEQDNAKGEKMQTKGEEPQQKEEELSQQQFSSSFLQQVLQQLHDEQQLMQNFVKDLKVIQQQQQQDNSTNPNNQEQIKKDQQTKTQDQLKQMEFEVADQGNDQLDNLLATNLPLSQVDQQKTLLPNQHQQENQENQMDIEERSNQPLNNNNKMEESVNNNFRKEKQQQLLREQNSEKNEDKSSFNKNKSENQPKIDFLKEQEKMQKKKEQEQTVSQQMDQGEDPDKMNDENQGKSRKPEEFSQRYKQPTKPDQMKDETEEQKQSQEQNDQLQDSLKKKWLEEKLSVEQRQLKLMELMKAFQNSPQDYEKGQALWLKIENEARFYSVTLCEELKAVLEPKKAAQFKGDYKSGKRLNMKKIIPYIASNFRKDKIWLRRSQPSKRTYQILLAIDDTFSMQEQDVGLLALQSLMTLSLAMSKMEVGQIAISGIKEGLNLVHDFSSPLTSADSPYILSQFSFSFQDINSSDLSMMRFMRGAIDLFKDSKQRDFQQICFIFSDGRFNKKNVRPLISEAEEANILFVFIILDNKKDENNSIMNIKSTNTYYKEGKLVINMKHYLEDFPFRYYIVVKNIHELSKVLVDILRQYLEMQDK